jgi:predicted RND superfamily exporter protein
MTVTERILRVVVPLVFSYRRLNLIVLVLITLFLGWHATCIRVDAGFEKSVPLQHPYMATFRKYQEAFGGANLISVALIQKEGEIYNERFMTRLKQVTDEVFFLPGVDRAQVTSLFTPGIRYIEITEDGIAGGDVMPANYQPTPEMFARIRSNVAKSSILGRIVSEDQRGAMIVAELLEYHPVTHEKLDYRQVAAELERIRLKHQDDDIRIHIIGFAKVIGDVTDASTQVASFFVIAIILTIALLWLFCGSFRLSLLPLSAALTAVVWELGLLQLAGYGLDPFAILVPFLILSVGVSHGVQYINGWGNEVAENNLNSREASIATFRRLFVPGTVAIITNVIGFATLAFIKIEIVREMAINATLGMAAVIITNKVMLPIVLSWVSVPDVDKFRRRQKMRQALSDRLWVHIAGFTGAPTSLVTLAVATAALAWAIHMYPRLTIGDSQVGVPELKPQGRYNRDSAAIVENFTIGVDVLKVVAETEPEACVRHDVLETIDRFAWHMQNVPGVRSVQSLPQLAKLVSAGWNEGSLKWRVIPRNQFAVVQAINPIPTSLGLRNADCSAMPVLVFTADHRAETIARVIQEAKRFNVRDVRAPVSFALASGNVGVMAATNEEIKAREILVIVWVHLTLLVFVWISFRSLASVVCIITPLVLCSLLTYGGMAMIGIGMKSATLPVAAFGVGIGVDAGIYIWSVIAKYLADGLSLRAAYYEALRTTGKAALFTSLSLIIAVFTWLFSGLQFQHDMGLLLLFMFTANLFGAILLLPALAYLIVPRSGRPSAPA